MARYKVKASVTFWLDEPSFVEAFNSASWLVSEHFDRGCRYRALDPVVVVESVQSSLVLP